MTREAIERLNTRQIVTIETYSKLIHRYRTNGNFNLTEEFRHKLRGYLTAMFDAELLTGYEFKELYLHYATKEWVSEE